MNNITKTLSSKSESEISHTNSAKKDDFITITEKIKLKKDQYEVLKIICDTYHTSLSKYIQEAVIEAMKFDIEEGNFCDTLLEKIDNNYYGKSKTNSPPPSFHPAPDLMKNDLDPSLVNFVVPSTYYSFEGIAPWPLLIGFWMKSAGTLVRTKKKKSTASTMTMTSIRTIDLTFNILNR